MIRTFLIGLGIGMCSLAILAEEQTGGGRILLRINNGEAVHEDYKVRAGTFRIDAPMKITFIETYHWNQRKGATPGTLGLRHEDGTMYGPWQTIGRPGMGNVPNAYWFVEPNVIVKKGAFTVVDSQPTTWSHNAESGHHGFVTVRGIAVKPR